MKKITVLLMSAMMVIVACNSENATDTGTVSDPDSLGTSAADDRNNRNATVYDSTGMRSGNRDTASYEAMPNKIPDTTRK
jgi:hypothetical protein